MRYQRWILPVALALVAIHLNYWMWDSARIVMGLPANLLYHVVLSVFLSLVMLFVVRRAWPEYLDRD